MNKKPLIIAGAIVALIVVVLIAIPLLVDANQFKPRVEAEAKAALGRDVTVGNLELSLFSGSVVVNDFSIADDPAFSKDKFVTTKAVRVGVEMMPLITSREVNVTSLTLEEPQITLRKNAAGKWNFDSLGAGKPATAGGAAPPPITIQELKVENGRVTLAQGKKQSTWEEVNVSVKNFSNTSKFPFEVSAKSPGGGSLELNGEAGPLNAGDMTQTPLSANVKVKQLDLAASGFVPADSGITGKLDYEGKAASDGKTLKSEGKATASGLRVVKNGAPAKQPVTLDYASTLDLLAKKGEITKGDITVGQSKATFLGTVDTRGESIAMNGRLKANGMSLDSVEGLLPAFGVVLPQGSKVQGGTVSTDLALQGPVDKLVITGPINVANTKVSNFNLKSRASGVSALAGIPSTSDLIIQALNSKVRVAPEGIRADGISVVVPGVGTVSGAGVISASNSLDFKMRAKLEGGGGLIGGMSAISTLGQSKGEIPFLIQGTTSNPVFLPDVAGALGSTAKAPVETVKGVGGVLGGIFGGKKK